MISRRRALVACAAAAVVLAVGGGVTLTLQAPATAPRHYSAPDAQPSASPDAQSAPAASAASSSGRLQIPALNLDTNLIPTQILNGAMALQDDPAPAYISAEPGLPVVVALHSSTLRDELGSIAVGNRLWDRDAQVPLLPEGSELLVDGVRYTTIGFSVMDKDELAGASVFSGSDSLLLVSCAQRADGAASTQNLAVTARRSQEQPPIDIVRQDRAISDQHLSTLTMLVMRLYNLG